MSYYFLMASIVAATMSMFLIYQEWVSGGYDVDNPTNLDCCLIVGAACFISLFWPVMLAYFPVMGVREFIRWYESKKRK